ncbi:MAG: hypothetical protein J5847_06660 [Clostridia bacterium]|nr:hypothetical protein [Clostridia bacterium]
MEPNVNQTEEKLTVGQKLAGLSGALLTLWQLVKFMGVGGAGGIIQAILQYVFPVFFDRFTTTLPDWLDFLYREDTLFDTNTAAGAADAAKYIVDGTVTWGYVLPFFLANIIANIFCYIMNKKYTFKSSAPRWHFVLYFVIMVLTIVFVTWMQGALYPLLIRAPWDWMHSLARLLLLIPCGIVQTIVFFIAQKLLLPPDPELVEESKAKADARAASKE